MIEIKNTMAMRIAIDGVELPFDATMIDFVRVHTSLQTFLPMLDMHLNDRGGIVTEYLTLAGGETIDIQYGVTPSEFQTQPLSFTVDTYDAPSVSLNNEQGALVRIKGMLNVSPLLFRPLMCRAWEDKRSSEVVEELAGDMKLKKTVEMTEDKMNWLQPNWTNAQLLRYLADRAMSSKGASGFVYAVDKDARLIFKSLDGLYRQPQVRQWITATNPELLLTEEGMTPKALFGYEAINRKELAGVTGGYGVTMQGHNWESGSPISQGFVPSDFDIQHLSDRINITTDDEDPLTRAVGFGRFHPDNQHDDWVTALGSSHVLRRMCAAFKLAVTVRGDNQLRVGDKVKIEVDSSDPNVGVHLPYSGTWLVERIIDDITRSGYWSKLVLCRAGVNAGERGARKLLTA